jgi:hypothetical protein
VGQGDHGKSSVGRPYTTLNLSAAAAYLFRMTRPYATVETTPGAFAALERLRKLETLLDRQFSVAGIRFGLDSVIGLVPVVGDLISGALGYYLIQEAKRLGVSRFTKARMYANWGVDVTVGAIPVVGDLFDVAFKSNTKNIRLLIADLEKQQRKADRAASRHRPNVT